MLQTNASKLEGAVQSIELQIEEAESNLGALKDANKSLHLKSDALHAFYQANLEFVDSTNLAESSQSKFISSNGLHRWDPVKLKTSELSVVFPRSTNQPELVINFPLSTTRPMTCNTSLKSFNKPPEGITSKKSPKFGPGVVTFVKYRIEGLCGTVTAKDYHKTEDMKGVIQQLEWQLGRIELTAKEISSLMYPYGAVFKQCDGNSDKGDFTFHLEFASPGEEVKLNCSFLIKEMYPFAPMEPKFDVLKGTLNVYSLKRRLNKTAKPGFGYLSRSIDAILAFMRCLCPKGVNL